MLLLTNKGGDDGVETDPTRRVLQEVPEWGGGLYDHPPNTGDIPIFIKNRRISG